MSRRPPQEPPRRLPDLGFLRKKRQDQDSGIKIKIGTWEMGKKMKSAWAKGMKKITVIQFFPFKLNKDPLVVRKHWPLKLNDSFDTYDIVTKIKG
jgi:hypothetical protein